MNNQKENQNNFLMELIMDEIRGKKNANNAYDKMIWNIRTGVLTLQFAGWGLIISEGSEVYGDI